MNRLGRNKFIQNQRGETEEAVEKEKERERKTKRKRKDVSLYLRK